MRKPSSLNMQTYCVDVQPQGLFFQRHKPLRFLDAKRALNLQLVSNLQGFRSGWSFESGVPEQLLGAKLLRLQQEGALSRATLVLGVGNDPFHPFQGHFDVSMKLLKVFEKYPPGFLVIQTRSPLVVLGMPVIRALAPRVSITIPVETHIQAAMDRVAGDLPRLEDRFKAMRTLRTFGVEVQAQVAPLLPYGDWREGAARFAQLLNEHADYVRLSSLNHMDERNLRTNPVALRLAEARQFHYLRPDAVEPLRNALQVLCPAKLIIPERDNCRETQLSIFAA